MGTEFGICEYPDVVRDVLLGAQTQCVLKTTTDATTPALQLKNSFLFPLALLVPGTQHIIDWVIKRAVSYFQWFPLWNASAKVLLQLMHSQNQRERLQDFLLSHFPDTPERGLIVKSLSVAGTRFAQWRWQTLHQVTVSLLRMQEI
ncbi:MAG: hypothetical protein ACKPKO_11665, partial [Candidatus Fonsibacter sp.]